MALNIVSSVHCLLWELFCLCSSTGGADSDSGFNLLLLRGIVIDIWGEKQLSLPWELVTYIREYTYTGLPGSTDCQTRSKRTRTEQSTWLHLYTSLLIFGQCGANSIGTYQYLVTYVMELRLHNIPRT